MDITIKFENVENKQKFFDKLSCLLEEKYFTDWEEEIEFIEVF